MSPLRRLLACAVFVALVVSSAALAGRGDPQLRLTSADTARAKSMVLRKADFTSAYRATPASRPEVDFYCSALDESDLTVTGRAISSNFTATLVFVGSYADVYESVADANASWRRGTSAAGQACLEQGTRQALRSTTTRFVSFRKIAFPRVAQRSIAFRAVAEQDGVRVFVDVVALQQSRAFVALSFGSALDPAPREDIVRLARTLAVRMKSAMRGG